MGEELEDLLLKLVLRTEGSWRRKINAFYLQEKMRQWGAEVINASNCYYESYHPLLHRPHLRWSRRLSTKDRRGRTYQMRTIFQLNPKLGYIPYCGGARVSHGVYVGYAGLRDDGSVAAYGGYIRSVRRDDRARGG